MSEEIKMSDVFDGEVVQNYDILTANGYDAADFGGHTKEARYVAHAINNHDRLVEELQAKTDLLSLVVVEKCGLVEENAELRDLLKKFIPSNDYYETNEDDEDVYCNYGGTFQYDDDSEHIGLEVVKLLNTKPTN